MCSDLKQSSNFVVNLKKVYFVLVYIEWLDEIGEMLGFKFSKLNITKQSAKSNKIMSQILRQTNLEKNLSI